MYFFKIHLKVFEIIIIYLFIFVILLFPTAVVYGPWAILAYRIRPQD